MTLRSHQTHRPSKLGPLTPLNEETTARYAACEITGGHQPSGESVMRVFPGGPRELPVCAVCETPYGGPKPTSWSSGVRVR